MTKTQHKYGRALRAIRSARGLSLSALAEKSGIHSSVLSRLETGEREIGLNNIRKLATAFELTAPSLLIELERPRRKRR